MIASCAGGFILDIRACLATFASAMNIDSRSLEPLWGERQVRILAGPCSAESREQTMATALALAEPTSQAEISYAVFFLKKKSTRDS